MVDGGVIRVVFEGCEKLWDIREDYGGWEIVFLGYRVIDVDCVLWWRVLWCYYLFGIK